MGRSTVMRRNAAMRRKYRPLALGLIGTIVVVLICLFVPGALLNFEGEQELGEIQQAKQRYYADNVSATDAIDFDFTMRVMMMEGGWKRDKTEIEAKDARGNIVSEEQARAFCRDTFHFFTWEMWELLPQLMDIDFMYYAISDEQKEYLAAASGNLGAYPGSEALEANRENTAEDETTAITGTETPYLVQDLLMDGDVRLYMYQETILNSYYFYVWEYDLKDISRGLDLHMVIDAVTLDVYSITVGGRLFDGLPWKEVMQLFCTGMEIGIAAAIQSVSEIHMPTALQTEGVWLPVAWFCSYYGMMMGQWGVMPFEEPSIEWSYYDVMNLGTEENGYTFYGVNFFVNKILSYDLGYNNVAIRLKNSNSSFVYMGFSSENDTFRWKASTSPTALTGLSE